MKRIQLGFAVLGMMTCLVACNSGENTTKATSTDMSDTSASNMSNNTTNNNNAAPTSGTSNKLPLTAADSTFAMEAAAGGMMEVEAGTLAQQNAQSERVKAFGAMMVRDHQAANQELMSLASGRGMTAPTTLPAKHQKMVDGMRNMKGKAFDNHYMAMMVSDHQKDVANYQKQATSGGDAELKAFAAKTLPVLQMHRDSATSINKTIK